MSSSTQPRQTRLAKIPVPAVKNASKSIGRIVFPEDDDDDIRLSLKHVWLAVYEALKQDSGLKEHLADQDEFFHNLKRKGEQEFIESLRDMAKAKSWEPLFNDGTFVPYFNSRRSDHVLHLEVFIKEKPDVDQPEEARNTALVEGTH